MQRAQRDFVGKLLFRNGPRKRKKKKEKEKKGKIRYKFLSSFSLKDATCLAPQFYSFLIRRFTVVYTLDN